ncbi:MAG: hypothetical protein CSA95_09305 [Bacteroidetes bacterium]|nr:MAG: hypothetical protein CSA95_09305 [Bacteroidota bacterium]
MPIERLPSLASVGKCSDVSRAFPAIFCKEAFCYRYFRYFYRNINTFIMRRLLFLALCLLPLLNFAQLVDIFQSKQIAGEFLAQRQQQNPRLSERTFVFSDVETVSAEGFPLFYVHFLESGGFVMVSADRRVVPVLAYAYEGTLPDTEHPEGYDFWIDQYAKAIRSLQQSNEPPRKEVTERWERLQQGTLPREPYRAVEPMLTTTWNQGLYYNAMCPEDPDGPDGRCYTGCVATAMGQLMNYFRWPLSGTGSYSYVHPEYGTISANYEEANYLWDAMDDHLNGYNMAVAELLFHAGVGVDMQYGPNGSGMYNHSAAYVLRTYFKYVPETQYVFRDSTSLDWDSIVLSNLNLKRPMYYAGWTSDSTIGIYGHAFVCDGYETEDYFHFNWGWGGSYDGYFYLDDLTPGTNFNYGQELITNMWPDTLSYDYPYQVPEFNPISHIHGTLTDGSGPELYQPGTVKSWLLTPSSEDYDSISSITIAMIQLDLAEGESYLRLYDGASEEAPLLAEYTGSVLPEEVSSTKDTLLIVFAAGAASAEGWKLSYSSQFPLYCSGTLSFTEETGLLSDGSGDKLYVGNNSCRFWIKDVGEWDKLYLYFDLIDLADEHDILDIYDPSTSDLLASFRGPLLLTDQLVEAENNQAYLYFFSDNRGNADGFEGGFSRSMVGVAQAEDDLELLLFPQPADEVVNLLIPSTFSHKGVVELIDVRGLLTSFNIAKLQQKVQLPVSTLKAGLYIVRIPGKERVLFGKVFVQ